MSFSINTSAGELFDLIMPAAFVISALVSTWVLASARRRLHLYYALALAVGTLFLPLIVFPIYLVIMLWRKRSDAPRRWRYALPLLYAAIALAGIVAYFYPIEPDDSIGANHLTDTALLFLGNLRWCFLRVAPVVENADLVYAL